MNEPKISELLWKDVSRLLSEQDKQRLNIMQVKWVIELSDDLSMGVKKFKQIKHRKPKFSNETKPYIF